MPDRREVLITESFEIAADLCEDLTPLVYARLFREHPDMEILFWRDKNHQVKGEMLSRAISAVLDFAGERLYAATMIQCEVITHEGYDVPPDVFAVFFGTVRDTLRGVLASWDLCQRLERNLPPLSVRLGPAAASYPPRP